MAIPVLPPDLTATLGFATNTLDRMAERREDTAYVASLWRAPTARTFVIARDQVVLKSTEAGVLNPLFSFLEAAPLGALRETILLGRDGEAPIFAALLDEAACVPRHKDAPELMVESHPDLQVRELRGLANAGALSANLLGQLAQAKSMLHWHGKHRFCATCGTPTLPVQAGWRRDCPGCGATHFPRTDPVVIMLATRGDQCLLGRQPRFPPGMYSALAGFLEPGETVEAAVRREIWEESGIKVGDVTYITSQPWPFPASLMIGCWAQALSDTITIDAQELEDARWVTRAEAAQMLAGTHPLGLSAPTPVAIAHHLLKLWVEAA